MRYPNGLRALVFAAVAALAGCAAAAGSTGGPRVVQPGAPGEGSSVGPPGGVAAPDRPAYGPADVRFMQAMIGHHEQALRMTSLVPDRAASEGVRLLARRIELSQRDEIDLMRTWLQRRGEPLPEGGLHVPHQPAGRAMPYGMLTAAELDRLAAARGGEFDRLFLELMIRHHEGAVAMVAELLESPAGGQEPEVFHFASGVAADQPIEIVRMRTMLSTL